MRESFINYRGWRYAVIGAGLSLTGLLAYLLDQPRVPPNGGTVLGYTLGTLAALLIVFLSAFGIRKRTFRLNMGTAVGWVSAHVYLGLAAMVLATLHCGLRLGWNVHSLAYVLMCLVTVSGLWGMYAYVRFPRAMSAQRAGQQRRAALEEIEEIDERSREIAASVPHAGGLIADAARRTDFGRSGLWAAIASRDESAVLVGGGAGQTARLLANPEYRTVVQVLAQMRLENRDPVQRGLLQQLLDMAGRRSVLLVRLRRETQLTAVLRVWLWTHVPVCCALLAALVAHILTVFLY